MIPGAWPISWKMNLDDSSSRRRTIASTRRECFVTVGATASFKGLIKAVMAPAFVAKLIELGFTRLVIQYGPDLPLFNELKEILDSQGLGLAVSAFDFNNTGLGQEMRDCKANAGSSKMGVVISHAGSGSILDAMRIDVPIIVVPNPELLDDHQTELAVEVERQGYCIHGRLDKLAAALEASETHSRKRWPPDNGQVDPSGRGLVGVLDEEMGWIAREQDTLQRLD